MRNATLTGVLIVVFAYTTIAQKLTLLPQVGFENSRTSVSYNNLDNFVPLGGEFSPQLGLRLDYKFKQGFGPFIGISTSRSTVVYGFDDPETGMNSYTANAGNMQIRFEGGYQYTTKALKLGNAKVTAQNNSTTEEKSKKDYSGKTYSRSGCYGKYRSYSNRCSGKTKTPAKQNNYTWVKLQPAMGIAYIPSVNPDVSSINKGGNINHEYLAGNWNTAFITGMGFEFGKNNQRLFTVSINYFNGLGNLNEQVITETAGSKTTVAHLQSDASGWNMRIGIPFTLSKNKTEAKSKSTNKSTNQRGGCGQYKTMYKRSCIRF